MFWSTAHALTLVYILRDFIQFYHRMFVNENEMCRVYISLSGTQKYFRYIMVDGKNSSAVYFIGITIFKIWWYWYVSLRWYYKKISKKKRISCVYSSFPGINKVIPFHYEVETEIAVHLKDVVILQTAFKTISEMP